MIARYESLCNLVKNFQWSLGDWRIRGLKTR